MPPVSGKDTGAKRSKAARTPKGASLPFLTLCPFHHTPPAVLCTLSLWFLSCVPFKLVSYMPWLLYLLPVVITVVGVSFTSIVMLLLSLLSSRGVNVASDLAVIVGMLHAVSQCRG